MRINVDHSKGKGKKRSRAKKNFGIFNRATPRNPIFQQNSFSSRLRLANTVVLAIIWSTDFFSSLLLILDRINTIINIDMGRHNLRRCSWPRRLSLVEILALSGFSEYSGALYWRPVLDFSASGSLDFGRVGGTFSARMSFFHRFL